MIWIILLLLLLGCAPDDSRVATLETRLAALEASLDSLGRQVSAQAAQVDSISRTPPHAHRTQLLQYRGPTKLDSAEVVTVDSCEGRFISNFQTDQGLSAEFAYWIRLSNHAAESCVVN